MATDFANLPRHLVHEAGHIVLAYRYGVAIVAIEVHARSAQTRVEPAYKDLQEAGVLIALAGAVAERVLLGDPDALPSAPDAVALSQSLDGRRPSFRPRDDEVSIQTQRLEGIIASERASLYAVASRLRDWTSSFAVDVRDIVGRIEHRPTPVETTIEGGGGLADLAPSHLHRWRQIAAHSEPGLRMKPLNESWMDQLARDRGLDGPWTAAVSESEGDGIWHEMAVLDAEGRVSGALTLRATQCVGHCGEPAIEVGYAVHPENRGAHLAERALRALVPWLARETGRTHVFAVIATTNRASLLTAQRAGLTPIPATQLHPAGKALVGAGLAYCTGSDPLDDEDSGVH